MNLFLKNFDPYLRSGGRRWGVWSEGCEGREGQKNCTVDRRLKFCLLCLSGAAMSQESKEDFVVLSDGTYVNDLDLVQMDQLESNGTIKAYVTELLKLDSASSLRRACSTSTKNNCPPAYMKALESGKSMFGIKSSTNPAADVTVSKIATANVIVGPPTKINYCPHINRLLVYGYLFSTSETCFVPFTWLQLHTYAHCKPQERCWRSMFESLPSGTCRPSCFSRRKIFSLCRSHFSPFIWYWKWVIFNLPQSCQCSA